MISFLDILTEIKDRLLANIPVFSTGYAYARLDSDKGLTVTVGNEAQYAGLHDTDGDYFYIRVQDKITAATAKAKTDCDVAITQRYPCTLVAAVMEADEFALADAIVNELLKTKVTDVKAIWIDAIAIVADEFRGLDKEAIESIKSKVGDRTLVRVDFELQRTFQTHNCSYSICKPC